MLRSKPPRKAAKTLIYYAAVSGLPALFRADFSYWPIRDSVVTVLDLLLFLVSVGYFLVAFRVIRTRPFRLVFWTVSAFVYLLFPAAQFFDPRPVLFPTGIAYILLSYFLLLSVLSFVAFLCAHRDTPTQVA